MQMQEIDISAIRPAPYNPRVITEEQFVRLRESLDVLGFIIPILVHASNNTIIAGHQRTKAGKANGITQVPAFVVESVSPGDEIKFNQLHNAVDEHSATEVLYVGTTQPGFCLAPPSAFTVIRHNAEYTKEICKLVLKYGNVLCAVVCSGTVIVGGNYIKACQLLNIPANTSVLPLSLFEPAKRYLAGSYGEYNYTAIKKETYVQGLAQLNRNIERTDGRKKFRSSLYDNYVLPYLTHHPKASVLDFGCGKGAYVKTLSASVDIMGLEFYNNNLKAIDITQGNRMIDSLVKRVGQSGRFDVVVCDSVLNSVDCPEAELNVLRCLNIFSSGKVFVSGRPVDEITQKIRSQRSNGPKRRYLQFLDSENYSGIFREGQWYFQHFHTPEQLEASLAKAGLVADHIYWRRHGNNFQAECHKARELDESEVTEAISYEFNLPLPSGRTYGRHTDVLPAVLSLYQ